MTIPLTVWIECVMVAAIFGVICSVLLAVPDALPSL